MSITYFRILSFMLERLVSKKSNFVGIEASKQFPLYEYNVL
jgi:hypothetical protein